MKRLNPSPYRDPLSMDFDLFFSFRKEPTQRTLRLVTHEQHGVAGIGKATLEVMEDAASGQISAGRDNDTGFLKLV